MKKESDVRATAEILLYLSHKFYLASFAHGLKPAQWVAMRYFSATNPTAATITNFANQIGCTKGTASRTVNHLIRRGLLEKQNNPEDGRSHFVELNSAGWTMMENDPIKSVEGDIQNLADEDLQMLQNSLIRLMANSARK